MAIKVIAQRREVKLGKNPGKKFVMRPDLYIPIQEKKVHHFHSQHGREGRVEEHRYPDYLSGRGRQRSEACNLWRQRRD